MTHSTRYKGKLDMRNRQKPTSLSVYNNLPLMKGS